MTSNQDLRSFVAEARQLGPEFFQSVSRRVDPTLESCVIQQKLAAEGRYPVLRFEDIAGSDLPLVSNLFGSYDLLGLAMGSIREGNGRAYWRCFANAPRNLWRLSIFRKAMRRCGRWWRSGTMWIWVSCPLPTTRKRIPAST